MKHFLLLIGLLTAIILSSCSPPDGCYYETVDTGYTQIVTTYRTFGNTTRIIEREEPVYERILICD